MSVHVYSSWPNWRGEENLFLEGARKEAALLDYPQEHLVVIKNEKSLSFCEIRNNSTPSLMFIRPPYKFVDRFQVLSKESWCHQREGLIIT